MQQFFWPRVNFYIWLLLAVSIATVTDGAEPSANLYRATMSANAILSSTATLPFNVESLDTGNVGTLSGGIVTLTNGGLYSIHADVGLDSDGGSSQNVAFRLLRNGAIIAQNDFDTAPDGPDGDREAVTLTYAGEFNANDQLSLVLFNPENPTTVFGFTNLSRLNIVQHNDIGGQPAADLYRATMSANAILSSTATLPFNVEGLDTGNVGTLSGGIVTLTNGGLYSIHADVGLDSDGGSSQNVAFRLLRNGAIIAQNDFDTAPDGPDGDREAVTLTYAGEFNANDQLSLVLFNPENPTTVFGFTNLSRLNIVQHNDIGGQPAADLYRATMSANAILSSTATLPFNVEGLDTGNVGTLSGGIVTLTNGGLYSIHADVGLDSDGGSSQNVAFRLLRNGAIIAQNDFDTAPDGPDGDREAVTLTYAGEFNANDQLSLVLFNPENPTTVFGFTNLSRLNIVRYNIVPEPSSFVLAFLGMIAIWWLRCKSRPKKLPAT